MYAINLMSLQAQRHHCVCAQLRQWTKVTLVVSFFLGAITLERYLAYRLAVHQLVAMEAAYDPIEEVKTSNKLLAKQVTAIRNEEQFVLALSDQEPTITLLGVVGQAVADTKERVFLHKIELTNVGLVGAPLAEKKTVLDLMGVANNGTAVNQLADALRTSVPFGTVNVTSNKDYRIKTQTMQDFTLQCDF